MRAAPPSGDLRGRVAKWRNGHRTRHGSIAAQGVPVATRHNPKGATVFFAIAALLETVFSRANGSRRWCAGTHRADLFERWYSSGPADVFSVRVFAPTWKRLSFTPTRFPPALSLRGQYGVGSSGDRLFHLVADFPGAGFLFGRPDFPGRESAGQRGGSMELPSPCFFCHPATSPLWLLSACVFDRRLYCRFNLPVPSPHQR